MSVKKRRPSTKNSTTLPEVAKLLNGKKMSERGATYYLAGFFDGNLVGSFAQFMGDRKLPATVALSPDLFLRLKEAKLGFEKGTVGVSCSDVLHAAAGEMLAHLKDDHAMHQPFDVAGCPTCGVICEAEGRARP